jgi:hypothetical protein
MLAALAWWAAGLRPFTATIYAAIGVAIAAVMIAAFTIDPPRNALRMGLAPLGSRAVAPWATIAIAALILEGVGLVLGGRSRTVPTLSTVVDHALVSHGARAAICLAWLMVGFAPIARSLMAGLAP